MSESFEWYCENCGYLPGSRVTFHETCDECHIPVVLHNREVRDAEIARLRAEVERLTRDRDIAERKAAVCREDAEINARRAESAEARVEQLEAGLRTAVEWVAEEIEPCDRPTRCPWAKDHLWLAKTRALLPPQPAPLPDLLAEVLPPKCWHCSYNGTVVVKFCMRDGCPETPKPKPAPCGRCGDSGRVTEHLPHRDADIPCPKCFPCGTCGDPAHAAADALAMEYKCPDCRGEEKK